QRARAQIVETLAAALENVDAIVTPSAPLTAQRVGQAEVNVGGQLLPTTGGGVFSRFTAPFNLSGGAAISVPCGLTAGGMPAGLQIASAPGRDELVLRLAAAYEDESGGRLCAASHSSDACGAESSSESSDRRRSMEATDEYR